MVEQLQYLHNTEIATSNLVVAPGLITLDAPDGTGKTTLSKYVADCLAANFGIDNVVLLSATNYLLEGKGIDNLRRAAENVNGNSLLLDKIYCASTNRAYSDVIKPALEAGKKVVVDRSEVDLIRYSLECGGETSFNLRQGYVNNGVITNGLWAGNRVYLTGSPSDIWENLMERGPKSKYDPKCKEDVEKRMKFQKLAEDEISTVPFSGSQTVIRIENKRVSDLCNREQYLRGVALEIVGKLKIN